MGEWPSKTYQVWADVVTKDWRLFTWTDVVEGLVKERAQLVADDVDKGLHVLCVYQTIGENSEALVQPEPRHGEFRVMFIPVSPEQPLEYLVKQNVTKE